MFNFLKSRRENLHHFELSFSCIQKAAIIHILMIIAKSDEDINLKEEKYLNKLTKALNFDWLSISFLEVDGKGVPFLYSLLNTLTSSQKRWSAYHFHGLAVCDGDMCQEEVNAVLSVLDNIGIEQDEFAKIIIDYRKKYYSAPWINNFVGQVQ